MDLKLHDIHAGAIESALVKARQYRSLLEPEIAESICLDILHIDNDNQQALVIYILALTDQIHHTEKQSQIKVAKKTNTWINLTYTSDLQETGSSNFLTDQRFFQLFEPRLINIETPIKISKAIIILAINGANIQLDKPRSMKTTSKGSIGNNLLTPERMNIPAVKNCRIRNTIFMCL